MAGRKTRCVPEVTEKILNLIRTGNYRETACAAAGVAPQVMREWLRRGAKGEEPYATFAREMDEAEAGAEARHVLTITSASKDDWRAAAWILSRKYHKQWGDKVGTADTEQSAPQQVEIHVHGPASVTGDGGSNSE